MIDWILSNWYVIIALFALLFVIGFAIYAFAKLPTTSQISALKEWLKYAVTMAEKELGSGTGQLKLRMVYDLFIQKFAYLAKFIPFETFRGYVDEALSWLNEQLASNKAVAFLVEGEQKTSEAVKSDSTNE